MAADGINSTELAERLRRVEESIRQSITATTPAAKGDEIAEVSLDAARRAQQIAFHHAGNLGQLNPRPAGLANQAIQTGKGALARSLDWMFRPQREFNQAVLQALNELTSALSQAQNITRFALSTMSGDYRQGLQQVRTQMIEGLSARLDRVEAASNETIRDLRWTYEGTLARHMASVEQTRLRLNEEVRELNRRLAAQAKVAMARPVLSEANAGSAVAETAAATLHHQPVRVPGDVEPEIDYFELEKKFRGTEDEIRKRLSFYLPYFAKCQSVLDLACGRGEFLELMREAGVPARGVDLDADMVGRCLVKELSVEQADVFEYLAQVPEASLDGIFSSQFVEHLSATDYGWLITEASRKLAPDGVLAIETQNPECLAIFSKSFYIDPTHVKPIPASQLKFLFEQAGLEEVSTHYLSPASRQFPLLQPLHNLAGVDAEELRAFNKAVESFNAAFFGGMDYAVIGRKPGKKAEPS